MTAPALIPASVPAFLPASGYTGLVRVGPTWGALSLPSTWAHHVLDVLGVCSGPVFEEPAQLRLVWILPPDGASDWPEAATASFVRYGEGDELLVPGPAGYGDGARWLRSPLDFPVSTDPGLLRKAVEFVFGPLDGADALRPLRVCQDCLTPTRDGRLTEEHIGADGPLYQAFACPRCWTAAVAGRRPRHLRVARKAPG